MSPIFWALLIVKSSLILPFKYTPPPCNAPQCHVSHCSDYLHSFRLFLAATLTRSTSFALRTPNVFTKPLLLVTSKLPVPQNLIFSSPVSVIRSCQQNCLYLTDKSKERTDTNADSGYKTHLWILSAAADIAVSALCADDVVGIGCDTDCSGETGSCVTDRDSVVATCGVCTLQLLTFILILFSHLRLHLPFKFPHNNFARISHFSHVHYMHSHALHPEFINLITFYKAKLWSSSLRNFPNLPLHLPTCPNILWQLK